MKQLFLAAGLAAMLATAGAAATFDIEVVTKNEGEATTSPFLLSINNLGTVAWNDYFRDPPDGSASDNFYQITQVDNDGNRTSSFTTQDTFYQSPILNDAGQVLSVFTERLDGGGSYQQLAILEPDGVTVTVVAERLVFSPPDRLDIPNYNEIDPSRIAINDNGDVAAFLRTTDDKMQIVKFPADGGEPVVIVEADVNGIFNISGLDINDAGQVVFIGTEMGNSDPRYISTTSVYVADGVTTQAVVTGDGFTLYDRPTINDNGDVAVAIYSSNGTQAGYIVQEAGGPTATPTYVGVFNTSGASVTSINLNDYGQVAYKYNKGIFVDGQLVLEGGQSVEGLNSNVGTTGIDIDLRPSFGLNNNGQLVVGVGLDGYSPGEDTSAVLRINQAGATYGNAITPFSSTADGQNSLLVEINNALGVESFIYLDPIVATGFVYTQEAGAPGFAELLIPTDIPLLQTSFTLEFSYGVSGFYSGTISKGDVFDFLAFDAAGIMSFSLTGIDVSEAVDPTDPFIVGLKFASGGFTSVVSIDAITFDTDGGTGGEVPLPAGLPLLLAGLCGLALLRRRHV